MSEHAPDDRLREFEARLNRLKDEQSRRTGSQAGRPMSGYGMAFTIAADLVGGGVGGAAIGWFLDRWAETSPLGLIAFFFLGTAAGMWNAYRTVRGYDMSVGFSRPPAPPVETRDDKGRPAGARLEEQSGDHRGQSTAPVRDSSDHPDPDRQR